MFRCSADISSAKSERRNFVYCAAKFNEYYGDSANNSAEHRRTCCQNRCQFEEIRGDLPTKWRRGELNPCPRRYPRKHLHVYPTINSEEPSHAPAHCRLPSVHKIDSRTGVVAPPIRQPAVHVCRRSSRPTANVTVTQAARSRPSLSACVFWPGF